MMCELKYDGTKTYDWDTNMKLIFDENHFCDFQFSITLALSCENIAYKRSVDYCRSIREYPHIIRVKLVTLPKDPVGYTVTVMRI